MLKNKGFLCRFVILFVGLLFIVQSISCSGGGGGGSSSTAKKPVINSVTPDNGIVTGNTIVVIQGSNFTETVTVNFGGNQAVNVVVNSNTQITATTPAGVIGQVNVEVINNDGRTGILANGFTYNDLPEPVVTSISPNNGPITGNTVVTIRGENFTANVTVKFNANQATGVVVNSDTQITATTPAGPQGTANVEVINNNGKSAILANGYTYSATPGPKITSISPNSASQEGGIQATISGNNFSGPVTVNIGASSNTSPTVVSSTQITVTIPDSNGTVGAVNIQVINADGKSDTLANAFTYTAAIPTPQITRILPTEGPAAGGTLVNIEGSNFQGGIAVIFVAPDNTQANATSVSVVDAGNLTCLTPPGVIGQVYSVTVSYNGKSSTLANAYTYIESGRWYRTNLNAPNTTKTTIWNPNALPLIWRGGHQAVWTGEGGAELTRYAMIAWGRNTSIITPDSGPVFNLAQPFQPTSGLEGSIIKIYGENGYSVFTNETKVSFKIGATLYSATISSIEQNTINCIVPDFPPDTIFPINAYIVITNVDGQQDICKTPFVVSGRTYRTKQTFQTPFVYQQMEWENKNRERVALGGYNVGAYLKLGATESQDKWSEISIVNAPTRRNGYSVVWTGKVFIVWGGYDDQGKANFFNTGAIYNPSNDTWTAMSTANAPSGRTGHTAVWTEQRMLIWGGHNAEKALGDGGLYNPSTNTWSYIAEDPTFKAGRCYHSSVLWTGSTTIVWGGLSNPFTAASQIPYTFTSGAKFTVQILRTEERLLIDPIASAPADMDRYSHSAVWTGTRMVVFGGKQVRVTPNIQENVLDATLIYDPVNNLWETKASSGTPRASHTAVFLRPNWMVVWGGYNSISAFNYQPIPLPNGDLYDTLNDTWTAISPSSSPYNIARMGHSAVAVPVNESLPFTNDVMVVWGGDNNPEGNTGFLYDPNTSSFRSVLQGSSPARGFHTAIVTNDKKMIVCGGADLSAANTRYKHGASYNSPSQVPPSTGQDVWEKVPDMPNISPDGILPAGTANRAKHTAVWTGTQMIVWGGANSSYAVRNGLIYTPGNNSWTPMTFTGAPSERHQHTSVWTGSNMIVWGGSTFGGTPLQTGGIYTTPTAKRAEQWVSTPTTSAPEARFFHTATWAPEIGEMIVWGGYNGLNGVPSGGCYIPSSNSWIPTTTGANTPLGRYYHTAVWTGSKLIVWGGRDHDAESLYNSGAIYTPTTNHTAGTDNWQTMSQSGDVPSPRYGHTAVWTGTEMIIWGGTKGPLPTDKLNDGARYNPTTDTWTKITSYQAPVSRFFHTAVWIGDSDVTKGRMIVFGGFNEDFLASGGVYLPYAQREAWYPIEETEEEN